MDTSLAINASMEDGKKIMDAIACFQIDDELYEQLTVNTYLKMLVGYVKDIYNYYLGLRDIFVLLVWFGLDIWVFIKAYQKMNN
ncbi:hypothetical protein [uncultured Ligilactobacillus sp.]|uniref:hypothetical protein n=1 Tax=uncultured Ligilactobacillus sp. TaxID=2837633 RepID=UPI00272A0C11|nr:hypothetical protein [uncultured Ligilactobacillus sp.]